VLTGPTAYLWVKTAHIVFVTAWFAGLFYLPRIFVNLAMVDPPSTAERERLILMAQKLYRFMLPLAVVAVGSGLWLWLGIGIGRSKPDGWLHLKLALVVVLMLYHHRCGRFLSAFENDRNTLSHRWYRGFNEVPVVLLLVIVALVVFKPF
jgi:protoporphyrinogen IX oxidase